MNTIKTFSTAFALVLAASTSFAQPPGERDGDRGRDRGGDGFRGGFGGGPPGGFGGGPPGGFGGGPPGGFSGGPPGGFDPSGFLSRLDANGNGVLDPEEQQGPAQFIIGRMQRDGIKVEAGKPIPLSTITKAFEEMRNRREGGSSDGRGGDSSRGRSEEPEVPQLLVPGFGIPAEEMPVPLLGFGPSAELLSVATAPEDLREAEERMRRYDENKDGFLDAKETSRFSGRPMDFDRNRDGKLSVSELSVRYAQRRVSESSDNDRRDDRRDSGRDRKEEVVVPDVYGGRHSFRTMPPNATSGLPGWFVDKDKSGDRQVSMAEYSSDWSVDVVNEFFSFDLNGDGFITEDECLRAVNNGTQASLASSGGNASSQASPTMSGPSANGPSASGPGSATSNAPAAPSAPPDEKMIKYAEKIISRYDTNKDGAITATEWSTMLIDPSAADANRDGRVTIVEYATWMQQRSKR